MTLEEAINLAWRQIMDEYGETAERINDFNIGSWLMNNYRNGELKYTDWEFEFYLKDATDFIKVGYYTVWVNSDTGEVIAMNDGM